MARASAPTSNRSWCRPCSPATSSLPTISGPTRSPASNAPSRLPGPPSGTCHPIARTSIPSSSASRSSRPSFAPLAVAAPRRSGRSSASAWRTSALTNAATIFGTAGTRPPHGHEKRFSVCSVNNAYRWASTARFGGRAPRRDVSCLHDQLPDVGDGARGDARALCRLHGPGGRIRERWRRLATAAGGPAASAWRRGRAGARVAASPRHDDDPRPRGTPDSERGRRPGALRG